MANNIITDIEKGQLYEALKYKMNDPDLSYHDIYNGLNGITPSYFKQVCIGTIICGLLCIVSLVGIICCENQSNLYVFGLIGYILGGCAECIILYKYQKMWYIALALFFCIGIIAIYREINLDIFKEWIASILSIVF